MKYDIVATGSKGNAIIIDDILMFDCGVSYKKIKDYDIQGVCLTHIHSDHFKKSTIKAIAKNKPLVQFFVPEYLVNEVLECGLKIEDISIIRCDELYDIGIGEMSTFKLDHDVENVGYKLNIDGNKVFYATDTGYLDENAAAIGYDYYFIEANYTEDEITEKIQSKEEADEFVYEIRVLDTHLSKEQADEFLSKNATDKSEIIYIHQHQD